MRTKKTCRLQILSGTLYAPKEKKGEGKHPNEPLCMPSNNRNYFCELMVEKI